jgi:hypothetical protein
MKIREQTMEKKTDKYHRARAGYGVGFVRSQPSGDCNLLVNSRKSFEIGGNSR